MSLLYQTCPFQVNSIADVSSAIPKLPTKNNNNNNNQNVVETVQWSNLELFESLVLQVDKVSMANKANGLAG